MGSSAETVPPFSGVVRKRRKEARPSELTAAALQLFVEKGFAATRLDDVAAHAGVSKLILSESRNFPEVAAYYHDKVIVQGRALMRAVLERGIARGEFREVNVEAAIDIVFSPLLMFVLSRLSVGFCGQANEPEAFLAAHFDLLMHGLCRSETQR